MLASRLGRIASNPRRAASLAIARVDSRRDPRHHWSRLVVDREIERHLAGLGTPGLSVVEISGSFVSDRHRWRQQHRLDFPEFDLCNPDRAIVERFDVVICSQVLEHVVDPWRAVATLHDLCEPGGQVVISTPFMLRYHAAPADYWRFTPAGLAQLIAQAGLEVVSTGSWGNAACIRANFYRWANRLPWNSLRNEPNLMVVVWAIAQRPAIADS